MPVNVVPSSAELLRLLPEILLTVFGVLLMVLEPLTRDENKNRLGWLAQLGLAAALLAALAAYQNPGLAFHNMMVVDGFGTFFRVLCIAVGLLVTMSSLQYLRRERSDSGEYYALILFSVAGQCLMVTANELIMIFIGLEISSIATYVLSGYLRDDKRNNESAVKYFLLGSFATAFLLYGIAWIYGITGSTNLAEIRRALDANAGQSFTLVGTAAALMFVGFAFKISAVPFQIWAPDVYQGAPAPVTAFMSAAPKAAAFAIFFRVFLTAFQPISSRWVPVVWVCALLTMIIGNTSALSQTNVKRMLAYSSIAHAGYILIALTADSDVGTQAAMFYLASYALMNVGAFAAVTQVARAGERAVEIKDFAGLSTRQPLTAILLTVFLLSLIGVPLTGGFFAKFYVFRAALGSNLIWLTVLGLLNSAVAAYYYLRIILVMFMEEPDESHGPLPALPLGLRAALLLSAVGTLILGIMPGALLDFAGSSAKLIR